MNFSLKRILIKAMVILSCIGCILLLPSCSENSQSEDPIKIGLNDWTGYDPFILADKTSLFNKHHVRVENTKFSSSLDTRHALKEGEIHGACLTLDEVVSLAEAGVKVKIVLVLDFSMGGDMIIGQKNLENFNDVVGKTIAVEESVVGKFLLDRALHLNLIKKSSVKIISVSRKDGLSAFRAKSIDALVCFNPVATTLLNEEEGNLLFSSSDIPFEIIDVLVFSELFYNDNKTAIANVIKSWFEAINAIKTNTNNAIEVLANVNNISIEEYKQSWEGLIVPDLKANKDIFNGESDKNIYKYSQVTIDFMIRKGLISKRVNTTDLFNPEIILKIIDSTEND